MKTTRTKQFSLQRGATMIEILVAILIFAIGLLAIVTAQTTGLSTTQSSMHRSYAAHLSYELVDLMRMNMTEVRRAGSIFDNYDTQVNAYNRTANCFDAAQGCTTQQMAQSSLNYWADRLQDTLPNGQATLVLAGGVYTLSIQWSDFRTDDIAQQAAAAGGAAAGTEDLIAARVTSFQL